MSYLTKSIFTAALAATAFCASASAQTPAATFTGNPATDPNATGLSYSQNFDNTAGLYPTGWEGQRIGGSSTAAPPLTPIVGAGGGTAGGVYLAGTADTDRALGSLASGSVVPAFGASFLNGTGFTLSTFTLSGFNEQWRSGSAADVNEVLNFQFSFNATSVIDSAASWISLSSFNLNEILTTETTAAAKDGNANRVAISATAAGLNWAANQTLWIRWVDTNDGGNDALLAVDDFSIKVGVTGANSRSLIYNPPSSLWDTNTTNTNWRLGTTATSFADNDVANFTDAGLTQGGSVQIASAGISTSGVNVSNTTGTYTFTEGKITGLGSLVKTGAGTLVLANTGNDYAGATTVSGGELRSGANEVIPNSSSVTVNTGGIINLNGFTETFGALNVTGGTVSVGAGRAIISALNLTGGTISSTGIGTIAPTNLEVVPSANASVISGILDFGTTPKTVTIGNGTAAEDLILNAAFATGTNGLITFTGEGTVRMNADNAAYTGTFRTNAPNAGLRGTTIVLGNGNAMGTGTFQFNGGTLSAAVPLTYNGVFSIGGNVTFAGSEMTLPTAPGLFGTGARTITVNNSLVIGTPGGSPGDLIIGGTVPTTYAGSGTITLNNSGFLQVGASGVLSPGDRDDATGTLTLNSIATQISGTVNINLGSTGPGGNLPTSGLNDVIRLNSTLTLDPTATLTGTLLDGFVGTVGDIFFVIINDGTDAITGQFAGLAQSSSVFFSGGEFQVSYTGDSTAGTFAGGGNDLALRLISVPEPVTGSLLAFGVATFGLRRRRRVVGSHQCLPALPHRG